VKGRANTRLSSTFQRLRRKNEAAFVPFLMAGDGGLDTTQQMLDAVVDAGADVIELGVPFSDPMADGPALQRAAERALGAGTTLPGILDLVIRFRRRCDVPIVLFGYANPFLAFGAHELAKATSDAGVDGVLCVDMPPDEADVLKQPLREYGIDMIFLLAPTSTPQRIRRVLRGAAGFVYFVSVAGVTGVKAADPESIDALVREIREQARVPVGIGFGITKPEQARAVAAMADAVVVGSEIARLVEQADETSAAVERVAAFTREMKQATRRA